MIDDQPNKFTVAHLTALRMAHEHWVRTSLSQRDGSSSVASAKEPFLAVRMRRGGDAIRTIMGADMWHLDNDTPSSQAEGEALADFLQELEDADVLAELPASAAIQAQLRANTLLEQLEEFCFVVYGCRRNERRRIGERVVVMSICYMLVLRTSNPLVQRKSEEIESLFSQNMPGEPFSNFVLCARHGRS